MEGVWVVRRTPSTNGPGFVEDELAVDHSCGGRHLGTGDILDVVTRREVPKYQVVRRIQLDQDVEDGRLQTIADDRVDDTTSRDDAGVHHVAESHEHVAVSGVTGTTLRETHRLPEHRLDSHPCAVGL